MQIKLIKSSFYQEAKTSKKLADFVKKAKVFSLDKECWKFEKAFAQKQGRKFAVFVSSGSSANLVLLQALLNLGRLKKGDRVGVSTLTWATNVMPVMQLGLVPVLIDCELSSLNVSPEKLSGLINKIKALFLTNALGFCDRIDKIKSLCDRGKIIFLEDNCESLGSKMGGKLLGNFGLASTFSFFVGHHLSTIEGGMVCTDDGELYQMLVMVRAHGWDRNLPANRQQKIRKRFKVNDFYAKYTFYNLAYNARPTEIQGFLGSLQLSYWDEIVAKREKNFRIFQQAIESNDDLVPLRVNHMDLVSNFAMPLVAKSKTLFNHYKARFEKNKVEIRPIIAGNIAKQPFYKKYFPARQQTNLNNADFIHQNGFYFPNNPELTKKEIKLLCRLLYE